MKDTQEKIEALTLIKLIKLNSVLSCNGSRKLELSEPEFLALSHEIGTNMNSVDQVQE